MAGFIVLGGYGISRIKSERVDAYNGLVEEQISLIEAGDYDWPDLLCWADTEYPG